MVWQFVKNYLFSKRAGALVSIIAWLSLIGITLSVAAMIVVLSVMNGFNAAIHKRLLSSSPHLSLDPNKNKENLEWLSSFARENKIRLSKTQVEDLILRPTGASFSGAVAKGLQVGEFKTLISKLQKADPEPDRAFYDDPLSYDLGSREIAMGENLATSLSVFEGDEITAITPESLLLPADEIPAYEKLKVKYILRSSVEEIDDRFIFYITGLSLTSFEEARSRQSIWEFYLPEGFTLEQIESSFAKKEISYSTWKDKNSSYLYALKLEKFAIGSFLGFTILIASFTILMVLVILISQKKKDIALLMTMGLSPNKTRLLFSRIGFFLGSFSCALGYALGLGISFVLANTSIIQLPQHLYYDYIIPVEIDMGFSFMVLVFSSVISFFGSKIPAYYSGNLNVSETIRSGA
ncbi:MAG: FtsX-like permease family protein [Bdellovibrionales bacterium]